MASRHRAPLVALRELTEGCAIEMTFAEGYEWEKSMKKLLGILAISGLVAAGVTTAIAAGDPIKERKELMKNVVGKNTKLAGGMVKGEVPFDAAKAAEAMKAIAAAPEKFITLFPKGSETGGETTAAPKIWEDRKGFEDWATKLNKAATAASEAAGQGADAFKVAFGELVKTCKGCHQSYRIKKEEKAK
ncbi:MAG: cytochrome c [Methyloligellaceae bacterium]